MDASAESMRESTAGNTFTPVWDISLPLAQTPGKKTNGFFCIFRKTQEKWSKRNCLSFETAVGGFEPLFPGGYICEGIVFEL